MVRIVVRIVRVRTALAWVPYRRIEAPPLSELPAHTCKVPCFRHKISRFEQQKIIICLTVVTSPPAILSVAKHPGSSIFVSPWRHLSTENQDFSTEDRRFQQKIKSFQQKINSFQQNIDGFNRKSRVIKNFQQKINGFQQKINSFQQKINIFQCKTAPWISMKAVSYGLLRQSFIGDVSTIPETAMHLFSSQNQHFSTGNHRFATEESRFFCFFRNRKIISLQALLLYEHEVVVDKMSAHLHSTQFTDE